MIDRTINSIINRIQKRFGRKKPFALGVDEWNDFYKSYKQEEPVRYLLCETIPDKFLWSYRKLFGWKIRRFSDYLRYRISDRYHVVKTDLEPGYYDKDTILFHANFSILVDFVESELAWMNLISRNIKDGSELSEKYKRTWFIVSHLDFLGLVRDRFRSKELGIDYLNSQIEYDPYETEDDRDVAKSLIAQIEKYRCIRDIYLWYVDTRPKRMDGDEGFTLENRKELEVKYGIMFFLSDRFREENPEVYRAYSESMKDRTEMRKEYDAEDTEMLKRLIDMRAALWT